VSGGEVEADESFIGGNPATCTRMFALARSPRPAVANKAMAFGILERGGQIRTMVLPDRQSKTVHPVIKEHVEAGAALFTDAMTRL